MTSTYAWIVTHDHIDNTDVVVVGPRDASVTMEHDLLAGKGRAFRLYDDDGELNASGRAVCEPGKEDSEEFLFGPLDDYGRGNYGCTEIRWAIPGGRWQAI
jgi:hypothetical protein